jgi:hypothetical protein
LALVVGLAISASAQRALASEGGASFYLLGSSGPEAAMMPPLPGVFFANTAYYYKGQAAADVAFTQGGHVVNGLQATIAANFATALWVPTTNFLGGTAAVGGILAFGQPWVDVSAILTGPRGNTVSLARGDTAFVFGDPALTAMLGWKRGNTHFQLSDILNIPIGEYRSGKGELANLAFHRWANDMSAAVTWHDDKSGWDVSAKSGFTLNGTNNVTEYRTGTEWHIEGSVEKTLSPAFSVGAQAYHFDQLTGDSGAGAVLGPFKGRVTGVGGTAAYNFKIMGKIPATLRLHGASEFNVQNRLQGHAIWLDFNMPLHVKMPPGASS